MQLTKFEACGNIITTEDEPTYFKAAKMSVMFKTILLRKSLYKL